MRDTPRREDKVSASAIVTSSVNIGCADQGPQWASHRRRLCFTTSNESPRNLTCIVHHARTRTRRAKRGAQPASITAFVSQWDTVHDRIKIASTLSRTDCHKVDESAFKRSIPTKSSNG